MSSKQRLIIIILVLVGLLSALGGILGNVAASALPDWVMPYLWVAWPLLGFVTLAVIVLGVWQFVLQGSDEGTGLAQSDANRRIMLGRVRVRVKDELDKPLYSRAIIELGLDRRLDAVKRGDGIANTWNLTVQQTGEESHRLPTIYPIIQIYDDMRGELLILGAAGAGKTTLLLELALGLLERAEEGKEPRFPVVFKLASWAAQRQSLDKWLVEELRIRYQVGRGIGQRWVDNDQLLLLLDGLDEVGDAHPREECMKAINVYREKHGFVPVVVSCRSVDYLNLSERLSLHGAMEIQPLTEKQIGDYLASAGGELEGVSVALREDSELREMATTPLMLGVMALAYYGKSAEDVLRMGSHTTRRKQVFKTYVDRVLEHRRGAKAEYTSQQTMHWLAWLAGQMARHSQSEFYIERMQPDWLQKSGPDWRYRLGGELFGGLVFWLVFGLVGGMLFESLVVGVYFGLICGLGFGSLVWVFGKLEKIEPTELDTWLLLNRRWHLILQQWSKNWINGLALGLFNGLVVGLVAGLRNGLLSGLVVGLAVGLVSVLGGWLSGGLIVWLKNEQLHEMLDESNLNTPNQGIWRSARNGVFFGLGAGLAYGLAFGLAFGLAYGGLHNGLVVGLLSGLPFGLLVGLFVGGLACIQHFALRLLLWRAGYMPLYYARFLDYAAEHLLLRKIGGGYAFIHPLLQEYFAKLDSAPTPQE